MDAFKGRFVWADYAAPWCDPCRNQAGIIKNLESALDAGNTLELLALSLDNGEISLTEYFYTSDFHFRNQLLLLEYRKERLLLEADLLKVYF